MMTEAIGPRVCPDIITAFRAGKSAFPNGLSQPPVWWPYSQRRAYADGWWYSSQRNAEGQSANV